MRSWALKALGNLDAASLASHGAAIVARLEDSEANAFLGVGRRLDAASLASLRRIVARFEHYGEVRWAA